MLNIKSCNDEMDKKWLLKSSDSGEIKNCSKKIKYQIWDSIPNIKIFFINLSKTLPCSSVSLECVR